MDNENSLQYNINNRIPEIFLQTNHVKRFISSCLHLCILGSDFVCAIQPGRAPTPLSEPCNDRRSSFVVWPITELEDACHSVTVRHETGVGGELGQSENGGRKTGECIRHSLCVCIKLYRTGRHSLFLCERIGCKIGHNKPSMKEREAQMFTGEGRVYSPDTMYNSGLI